MRRVTWLEPRTPHQPGKLQKLSKNEFVFTPLIFGVNKKGALLSAEKSSECTPSTGRCRVFGAICDSACGISFLKSTYFWDFIPRRGAPPKAAAITPVVKIPARTLLLAQFREGVRDFLCVLCGLCGQKL
jgi:hypothetical protein